MKKRMSGLIFLFVMFILANCTSSNQPSYTKNTPSGVQQTVSTIPAKPTSSSSIAIPTAYPTAMNTAAPSELAPNPTATIGSENMITKNCLNVLPSLPRPNGYQGKLILRNFGKNLNLLYDIQTAQITKMTGNGDTFIEVSPDGTRYVYHDENSSALQIYSSAGRLQRSIFWEKEWLDLGGWLDNNRLIFEIPTYTINSMGFMNVEYPEPLMLLDLTTMQKQKLLPDFPNIDPVLNQTNWGSGTTLYDASLSRVIYPGDIGGFGYYILWDVPNKKELAELPSLSFSEPPAWSPDWSRFIANANFDINIVTRDGVIDKITNYDPAKGNVFNATAFNWSPDGRYVAFWLEIQSNYTLIVLDTQTGKMVDYCIQPVPNDALNDYPVGPPMWSPEGNAFAVEASTGQGQTEINVVLVDIEKGIAARVTSGLVPVGWLAAP